MHVCFSIVFDLVFFSTKPRD